MSSDSLQKAQLGLACGAERMHSADQLLPLLSLLSICKEQALSVTFWIDVADVCVCVFVEDKEAYISHPQSKRVRSANQSKSCKRAVTQQANWVPL